MTPKNSGSPVLRENGASAGSTRRISASDITSLARRRGIYRPAYDIYGGLAGFVDYGPVGVRLRRRLIDLWRHHYVLMGGCLEIDGALVGPEALFRASGHLSEFDDRLVECRDCGKLHRADHLAPEAEGLVGDALNCALAGLKCPACGGALSEPRAFNLMFSTRVGAGKGLKGYLRPETAQSIFQTFPWLLRQNRGKLPLAVAQVGRAFRNEIAPRQGLLRLREFSQLEIEHFFLPGHEPPFPAELADVLVRLLPAENAPEGGTKGHELRPAQIPECVTVGEAHARGTITSPLLATHIARAQRFLLAAGLPPDQLRWRQHAGRELAHYASDCWDGEVSSASGWIELIGVAQRGDYDLRSHGAAAELRVPLPGTERDVERWVPDRGAIGKRFRVCARDVLTALEASDTVTPGMRVATADGDVVLDESYLRRERIHKAEMCYPHVVEPSLGLDRLLYCLLETTAHGDEERSWLALPPAISPYAALVAPLMTRDGLVERARDILDEGLRNNLDLLYDDAGSIGRRYARADEVGIKFAITVDYETLENDTVTLRDRDTTEQTRLSVEDALTRVKNVGG